MGGKNDSFNIYWLINWLIDLFIYVCMYLFILEYGWFIYIPCVKAKQF
jgi:hypothetical protein